MEKDTCLIAEAAITWPVLPNDTTIIDATTTIKSEEVTKTDIIMSWCYNTNNCV